MTRLSWYSFENRADDVAELRIYQEIGFAGVTAQAFVADLKAISARQIDLRLNSPGGDALDSLLIYSALRTHPATVTVFVDGLAASGASVIAMSGDRVVMARHSAMMIHEAHGPMTGTAADFLEYAEVLEDFSDRIADIYQERVPDTLKVTWRRRMKAETWYTEEAAVAAGLADMVGAASTVRNCFDLSAYKNVPEWISAFREAATVDLGEILIASGRRG